MDFIFNVSKKYFSASTSRHLRNVLYYSDIFNGQLHFNNCCPFCNMVRRRILKAGRQRRLSTGRFSSIPVRYAETSQFGRDNALTQNSSREDMAGDHLLPVPSPTPLTSTVHSPSGIGASILPNGTGCQTGDEHGSNQSFAHTPSFADLSDPERISSDNADDMINSVLDSFFTSIQVNDDTTLSGRENSENEQEYNSQQQGLLPLDTFRTEDSAEPEPKQFRASDQTVPIGEIPKSSGTVHSWHNLVAILAVTATVRFTVEQYEFFRTCVKWVVTTCNSEMSPIPSYSTLKRTILTYFEAHCLPKVQTFESPIDEKRSGARPPPQQQNSAGSTNLSNDVPVSVIFPSEWAKLDIMFKPTWDQMKSDAISVTKSSSYYTQFTSIENSMIVRFREEVLNATSRISGNSLSLSPGTSVPLQLRYFPKEAQSLQRLFHVTRAATGSKVCLNAFVGETALVRSKIFEPNVEEVPGSLLSFT